MSIAIEKIPPADRISLKEKIGYSLGDAASNFYWKTFEFFLMIFYTDVFGISAAAVGTMLLVTRLADAVADPVDGSDRRPDEDALGPLPALCSVVRAPAGRGRRADLHHAQPRQRRQAGVRLRHLQPPDVPLHRGEHPLHRAHGRDDAELAGTHFHLLDPLHRRLHGGRFRPVLHAEAGRSSSATATTRAAGSSPWCCTAFWQRLCLCFASPAHASASPRLRSRNRTSSAIWAIFSAAGRGWSWWGCCSWFWPRS